MKIATTIAEVRAQVREWKQQGLTVGLVPTMGYLHEGHASLVKTSVQQCDRTVASVFLNPTQFGPGEDLDGFATFVEVQSEMPRQLCGKTRPIHFRGVCTVVSKLFNIVTPDKAFFGQKDAQQLAIIRRMVLDLSMGIEIVGCPIIREADGLAKSSRNTYLSAEERKAALVLSRAVKLGRELVRNGEKNADAIVNAMRALIEQEPLARIDYVSAVDGLTMLPVHEINGGELIAMAVYIGKTRLIDNFSVEG